MEFMQKHDTVTPEQVIEVPKLSHDTIPQRSTVRRLQTAEQLVEVPTDPVYVAMVLASKVYSRREIRRILSGQGSTASGSEQIVDNPVPQGRRRGVAESSRFTSRTGFNSVWWRRSRCYSRSS